MQEEGDCANCVTGQLGCNSDVGGGGGGGGCCGPNCGKGHMFDCSPVMMDELMSERRQTAYGTWQLFGVVSYSSCLVDTTNGKTLYNQKKSEFWSH